MATKNYMINDKWLDLDKQNIVELQSVDGVLDSLKVNGSEIETPSGKITITENGTDIDIAQYALADVNVEGGGGSSDFSTAEVKAVQNVLGVNFKTIAYIDDGEMLAGYDEADEFFMRSFGWVTVEDPLNVVMYDGQANLILARNGEMHIVATENPDNVVITYDEDMGVYNLALTGDCTITISAE